MTRIGVAFISDRDGHLADCMDSFSGVVDGFAPMTVIDDRDHRLGLAGAARAAWQWAVLHDFDYLLHIEEDFRLLRPFVAEEAVALLESNRHLAQVVLRRQPWSIEEIRAGGIIETAPEEYDDCQSDGVSWVEHDRIFSLNPCVIPKRVLRLGWPDGNEAEMTDTLTGMGFRFAFWGDRWDPPMVLHVGTERAAGWRL